MAGLAVALRARSRERRWGLAGVLAVGYGRAAAPIAVAASPSVGAPTATVTFLTIECSAPTLPDLDVVRVELVIDVEGSTSIRGDRHPDLGQERADNVELHPRHAERRPAPNTDLTARFRLTPRRRQCDPRTAGVGPLRGHAVRLEDAFRHVREGPLHRRRGHSFGQRAVKIGDDAIREVSTLLGVTETDPIDFHVTPTGRLSTTSWGPETRRTWAARHGPEIRHSSRTSRCAVVDDPWVGT